MASIRRRNGKYQVQIRVRSYQDRLRTVQCPSDIIDQISGWQTAGVGQISGEGYELDILNKWLKKVVFRRRVAKNSEGPLPKAPTHSAERAQSGTSLR